MHPQPVWVSGQLRSALCFANIFSTDLAIDLGTANTLIYGCVTKASCWTNPLVVSIRHEGGPNGKKTGDQAVGAEAKAMLGKVPGNIEPSAR